MSKLNKINKLKALAETLKVKKQKLENAKKLEESLNPSKISKLLESELAQAEIILAAKDFSAKLQKMAEDLAKMQAEALPLSDNMKETFGPEKANEFEDAVNGALQDGLAAMRDAKDKISNSILRVEGKPVPDDTSMNNDMAAMGDDSQGDLDLGDDTDDFGGEEAAAGPEEDPLGRAKKESFDYRGYGKKVLVNESIDSLVGWLFEDVAGMMPSADLSKFAGQIAAKSAKDPVALAGWIGKRKYNPGAEAQMSSTLDDVDSSILDETSGFKNYKVTYTYKDSDNKKIKGSMTINTFSSQKAEKKVQKYINDISGADLNIISVEPQNDDAVSKDLKKSSEEKLKDKIDENIGVHGKGFAARAIAEIQSTFPLSESSESLAEAFEAKYGMTPQAYSVKKAAIVAENKTEEFDYTATKNGKNVEGTVKAKSKVDAEEYLANRGLTKIKFCKKLDEANLNPEEKKQTAATMGKIATNMQTDKGYEKKNIQQTMSQLDPKERNTATKIINDAKAKGKSVNTVADYLDAANNEVDDKVNESEENPDFITSRKEFVNYLNSIGFQPDYVDKTKKGYSAKTNDYNSKTDSNYVIQGKTVYEKKIATTNIKNVFAKVVHAIDYRGNPGYSLRIYVDLSVVPTPEPGVADYLDAANNDVNDKVNETDLSEPMMITSRNEFIEFLKSIGFKPNYVDKTKAGYSAKTSAYDGKTDADYIRNGAKLFQSKIDASGYTNVWAKGVSSRDYMNTEVYSVRIYLDLSGVPVPEPVVENINALAGKVGEYGQYVSVGKGSGKTTETPSSDTTFKSGTSGNSYKKPAATPKGKDEPSDETPWDVGNKEPSEKPIVGKKEKKSGTPLAQAKSKADTEPKSEKGKE